MRYMKEMFHHRLTKEHAWSGKAQHEQKQEQRNDDEVHHGKQNGITWLTQQWTH